MGIGRNDPCPCGSGKKYKRCCLQRNVVSTDELEYRRLSEVYDKLMDRLFRYAEQVFGPGVMHVALEEYLLWPEDEDGGPDAELLERHMPLFLPWFVFNWEYEPMEGETELSGPSGQTVAELYALKQGPRLDSYERRLIEAANRRPHSFYEVLEVEPGWQILLQNVLSGERITV